MGKIILAVLQIIILTGLCYGQTVGDYLILNDIGQYKLTKGLLFRGRIVGAEPKVSRVGNVVDGYYTSYETSYAGGEGFSAPTAEVRVYDSTQWLLHEVERDFRTYYGLPGDSFVMRVIDGNTIMAAGSGGWDYRWLSGNKVIRIEYTDLMMEKPQPLEVVGAYLSKHPSTLTTMTSSDLRTNENKTKWIKDEMDRRLWLGDKWFMQLQLKKAEEKQVYQESVKSMKVFLDYREKYYGIKAADEKNLLDGYLMQNNGTGIKTKLTEYKNWWSVNKDKAISL